MKEGPKETPLDVLDVVDMSQRKEDFAGNITGLYNAMIQVNPNEGCVYLGKLHGFGLVYDGIILSVGHLEMDEKSTEALRDNILGEGFQGEAFGNPLGTPEQILVEQGEIIEEMWGVPVDFINWPDHFVNSPDVVFDSLNDLAKRLHAYRKKVSGFDKMKINENSFERKEETKRLQLHRRRSVLVLNTESSPRAEHVQTGTSQTDKKTKGRFGPFGKFLGKFGKKT